MTFHVRTGQEPRRGSHPPESVGGSGDIRYATAEPGSADQRWRSLTSRALRFCPAGQVSPWPPRSPARDRQQGQTVTFTAPAKAGTYPCICTTHPCMNGSLTVRWRARNPVRAQHTGAPRVTSSCVPWAGRPRAPVLRSSTPTSAARRSRCGRPSRSPPPTPSSTAAPTAVSICSSATGTTQSSGSTRTRRTPTPARSRPPRPRRRVPSGTRKSASPELPRRSGGRPLPGGRFQQRRAGTGSLRRGDPAAAGQDRLVQLRRGRRLQPWNQYGLRRRFGNRRPCGRHSLLGHRSLTGSPRRRPCGQ